MNTPINQFIEDLSSLSPLTSEYEMNCVSLSMYFAMLKKHTDTVYNKSLTKDAYSFVSILKDATNTVSSKYNISREYINNYMVLFRMNKSTEEQKLEYKTKIQNITIKKINSSVDIISSINNVIIAYNKCKDLYEDDQILSNELCISNIKNIRDYMFKYAKSSCDEIEDENILFDILEKLNRKYSEIQFK